MSDPGQGAESLKIVLQMLNMREGASKFPQHFILLEYHTLEYFYLVLLVGSPDLNDSFGLMQDFVTWGSRRTSTKT